MGNTYCKKKNVREGMGCGNGFWRSPRYVCLKCVDGIWCPFSGAVHWCFKTGFLTSLKITNQGWPSGTRQPQGPSSEFLTCAGIASVSQQCILSNVVSENHSQVLKLALTNPTSPSHKKHNSDEAAASGDNPQIQRRN